MSTLNTNQNQPCNLHNCVTLKLTWFLNACCLNLFPLWQFSLVELYIFLNILYFWFRILSECPSWKCKNGWPHIPQSVSWNFVHFCDCFPYNLALCFSNRFGLEAGDGIIESCASHGSQSLKLPFADESSINASDPLRRRFDASRGLLSRCVLVADPFKLVHNRLCSQ